MDPEGLDPAETESSPVGIEIAPEQLAPATLRQVVEEFITREGTDYGRVEASFEEKVADVMRQLDRGEARIVFDPESETVNLVTEDRAPKPRKENDPS